MVLSVGTVKKAEHWRIDAFELSCWRRLLRVPWNVRRSNQSILREISPGCSLEGLILKLKLQYFGHLTQKADSFEKTLMLGKTEGRWRRGRQRMRWLVSSPTQWTWVWVYSGSWWWTGRPNVLQSVSMQGVVHDWVSELNWLSWWCHPTISSSVTSFYSYPQSFPASGSFLISQLFASGGQSIVASAIASVLPINIQGWFPLGLTCLIALLSKGLSRVFSSTTIQKHQFFGTQSSLWSNSQRIYKTNNRCVALLQIQDFPSPV